MASIPFAFSVHHFVSSVGADAGFAAIIGLAILVFLYFAQARETASLRRQAEEAADHVQQLELRVAQLSRSGVGSGTITPPPAPPPPGIARTAAPAAAAATATGIAAASTGAGAPVARRAATGPAAAPAGIPAAPAGVGAPALSSATRLIPISETDPVTTHTNGGPAGLAVVSPSGPAPATAAGGATAANGASGSGGTTTAPPPARAAGGPPARPPAGRPPLAARGPAGSGGRSGGSSGGSRVSRGFIILLSLLGIVAVVVVLLVVTSGGGSSSQSTSTPAQNTNAVSHRARNRRAAAVTPASVTVAVLNGTSIANLAHDVGQRLSTAGFKEGALATAADQTQTATVVGYLPGHKAAALLVARSLKLGPASVQPVDQSNRAVACPGSTPCTAKVVVTVGSDLASTQTQ